MHDSPSFKYIIVQNQPDNVTVKPIDFLIQTEVSKLKAKSRQPYFLKKILSAKKVSKEKFSVILTNKKNFQQQVNTFTEKQQQKTRNQTTFLLRRVG
jgi:hypothetical protein